VSFSHTNRRLQSTAGFTLVELLVASAIALTVMGAVATLFGIFGRTASQSQAIVDLTDKIRSVAWRMRQDLAGVTVELTPWTRPESNSGYFEMIEGTAKDSDAANGSPNIAADMDDVLMFTTRSTSGPFVGKFDSNTIESPTAEVAWFCKTAANQPVSGLTLYNLYRRQLLVTAYVGVEPFLSGNNSLPGTLATAYATYDISLRLDGTALYPNALSDLTKRENRFLHTTTFPYAFLSATAPNATFDGTVREGEDIVLSNVIGFDVRVFDPEAPAQQNNGFTLYPGDPGYGTASPAGSKGSFVDLGGVARTSTPVPSRTLIGGTFAPAGSTAMGSNGMYVSGTSPTWVSGTSLAYPTYDTWSMHYEFNGVDDDLDALIDEGTNGLDDNNDGLPDDIGEFETSPPYPVPLRGIEVRIRCYEPSSKQVRQTTIRHTFIAR
jgi:prepilin-type N-terminal cleavage/methylation domain-containing protein